MAEAVSALGMVGFASLCLWALVAFALELRA